MDKIYLNPRINWAAHSEFLIFDKTDGELQAETDSMICALRFTSTRPHLVIITFAEAGYPVTIAPL